MDFPSSSFVTADGSRTNGLENARRMSLCRSDPIEQAANLPDGYGSRGGKETTIPDHARFRLRGNGPESLSQRRQGAGLTSRSGQMGVIHGDADRRLCENGRVVDTVIAGRVNANSSRGQIYSLRLMAMVMPLFSTFLFFFALG